MAVTELILGQDCRVVVSTKVGPVYAHGQMLVQNITYSANVHVLPRTKSNNALKRYLKTHNEVYVINTVKFTLFNGCSHTFWFADLLGGKDKTHPVECTQSTQGLFQGVTVKILELIPKSGS